MTRLRIKDERTLLGFTEKADIYDRVGGCSNAAAWRTYAQASSSHNVGRISSMKDEVVPNFRALSAKGFVFMNPMTQCSVEVSAGDGNTPEFEEVASSCTGSGSYQPYKRKFRYPLVGTTVGRLKSGFDTNMLWPDGSVRPPISFLDDRAVMAAITEASTACLNDRGRADSNLYETLAEANKLLGTIPGIIAPALRSISQKSGLLGRAREQGSAYLAYRYGLKPVMSDLEAIQKGLLKKVGKVRQTSRGKVTLSATKTEILPGEYGGACTFNSTYVHNELFTVRAMSLDEHVASVASNIGFTSKGLITLPWELLPYSFVYDWFANFGEFIGSLVPAFGYNQLGSCLVIERMLVSNYSIGQATPNSGLTFITPVSGSCKRVWSTKTRTSGPLSGGLVVKSDFRLTNLTRAADAISLILQKVK